MLLVDAGAETEMGYAGDMSSTICADKTFTIRQKEVYDIQVASHTDVYKRQISDFLFVFVLVFHFGGIRISLSGLSLSLIHI